MGGEYFQTTLSRQIRQTVRQASLTPSYPNISLLQKGSLAKRP